MVQYVYNPQNLLLYAITTKRQGLKGNIMKRDEYWKNFKLGKELDISGRFIYNGLQAFHEMRHFAYEEEIFEFLYHISVGIERLLKIAIILIEHNDGVNQVSFEKSLISHNHERLARRVEKEHQLELCNHHYDFLILLSDFYKISRYERYSLTNMTVDVQEKTRFVKFLNNGLSVTIDNETPFSMTPNDSSIRKFVGQVVGRISGRLYDIIYQEARRLNIHTYEIRRASKAYKIFNAKDYDFEMEDILRRELLVYFVHGDKKGKHTKLMRSLKPLEFDPALEADYVSCFDSNVNTIGIMGELETLYIDNVWDMKKRKDILEVIGSPGLV